MPYVILLVVVRVRRNGRHRHRVLLQLLHHDRDCPLQLHIVTRGHIFRQLLHFDIRWDAVTFHLPLAVQTIDPVARRGD